MLTINLPTLKSVAMSLYNIKYSMHKHYVLIRLRAAVMNLLISKGVWT